jgi:hypothetical protein
MCPNIRIDRVQSFNVETKQGLSKRLYLILTVPLAAKGPQK